MLSRITRHLLLLCLIWTSAIHSIGLPSSKQGPSDSTFEQITEFHATSLSAFVDVNADRRTDTITVNSDNSISVLLEPDARESNAFIFGRNKKILPSRVNLISNSTFKDPIRSITASDFNGDSVVDLLVITSATTDPPYNVFICYGVRNPDFKVGDPVFVENFSGQPLIADFNGDRIADIYGQVKDSRVAFFGGLQLKPIKDTTYKGPIWSKIGYTAYGDFNLDGQSDAIITVETESGLALQFLSGAMETGQAIPDFSKAKIIPLPNEIVKAGSSAVVGQFRLADFNMDSKIDLLLPACAKLDCKDSSFIFIMDFIDFKWKSVPLNLKPVGLDSSWSNGVWAFTPITSDFRLSTSQLVGFSHGDIDLDSFVDLTVGLTYHPSDGKQAVTVPAILLNDNMSKFQAYLTPGFDTPDTSVYQMAFFDQNEDGILDLWIVTGRNNFLTARLVKQTQNSNNYFLMVMILNGLCPSSAECNLAYGLPMPGSSASFNTYTIDGKLENSTGVQAPLSTFNSLELPYIIFGLNELGNYIENVHAHVPDKIDNQLTRKTEFTVPDSQLVVNPYPKDSPANWHVTLYLQPLYNMKVLFIAITLLSLCIILALIIGVLQYLERKEDMAEKMTEAQGFHFDSM